MPVDTQARIIDIADAVVADLNANIAAKDSTGAAIHPRFTAVRSWWREFRPSDRNDLQIDVRPTNQQDGEESRGANERHFGVEIVIQQRVEKDDPDRVDALISLGCRIAERYFVTLAPCQTHTTDYPEMTTALGAGAPVQCRENVHVLYDPNALSQNRFFSVVSLTFAEYRDT